MIPTRDRRRRSTAVVVVLMLAYAIAPAAYAQVSMKAVEARAVKVTVGEGATGQVASGFLWGQKNQVVTSLHTFSKRTTDSPVIRVTCHNGGVRQISQARVSKVLAEADLVLLTTTEELTACEVFTSSDMKEEKPAYGESLHTWGYKGGADGGSSRTTTKGSATPEDLKGLLNEPLRSQVAAGKVPKIDLPIYYVQGGLLPGYSGAPVVDSNTKLVGIVEGGLDNGASDYNWVIPITNVRKLLASQEAQLPRPGFLAANVSFSSGFAAEAGDTSLEVGTDNKRGFHFELTKIRSIGELPGIEGLMSQLGSEAERKAFAAVQLNIYEDVSAGVIIALPAGQAAEEVPPARDGDGTTVISAARDARDGQLLFKEMQLSDNDVFGDDMVRSPGFAGWVVDSLLKECNSDAWGFTEQHECTNISPDAGVEATDGGWSISVAFVVKTGPSLTAISTKIFSRHRRMLVSEVRWEPTPGQPTVAQQTNVAAHALTRFDVPGVMPAAGTPMPAPSKTLNGRLAEGTENRQTLPGLEAGQQYAILGRCDDDCANLDLGVLQDGVLVAADTDDNDTPVVTFAPRSGSVYQLVVAMPSCSAAGCAWQAEMVETAPAGSPAPSGAGAPPPAPSVVLDGRLSEGAATRVRLPGLDAGRHYVIFGECGKDCADLDFAVWQGGARVAVDEADDDEPEVTFEARPGSAYELQVDMASCAATNCHWEAKVAEYGRWTTVQSRSVLDGSLAEGQSVRVDLPRLPPGQNYVVSGECDDECDDLDLGVLQNGKELDRDEEDDAFPAVGLASRPNAAYQVEVTMASCGAAVCRWEISLARQ